MALFETTKNSQIVGIIWVFFFVEAVCGDASLPSTDTTGLDNDATLEQVDGTSITRSTVTILLAEETETTKYSTIELSDETKQTFANKVTADTELDTSMDTITTVTEENELPNQTSTELLPFNSSGTQVESLGIFRTVSTTSETSVSDHLSSDLTTYFPSKSMNTSISLTEGRTPVDTAVSETPTSVVSSKSNRMYPYTRFTTVGSSEKSNRIATEHFGESNMNAITSEVSSLSVSRNNFTVSTTTDHKMDTTRDSLSDVQSVIDCNTLIVILSSVFVLILMLISICCLCAMWRIRKTWRQKLKEEKHKTDIWTMSTFNNTVVNENYIDFNETTLQNLEHENVRHTGSSSSTTTSGTRRSSAGTSGTRNSVISSDSASVYTSFLGQRNSRASRKLPSKLLISRSKSSYSTDALAVQDPESRGRASTFTHGRRKKGEHDKHNLVDHIETEEDHNRILESVDNILKPQNKHIVTEL